MRILSSLIFAASLLAASVASATPTDYSFTGNLANDDDVQLFHFTVGAPSTVTLRTWSYAGGVNAAGDTIARGGFDPILALFDAAGLNINMNDDGGVSVAADAVTGQRYDTFLSSVLNAGDYTVSVSQYNNFAGTTLTNGFLGAATTGWVDFVHNARNSSWAFDILNVESAVVDVPEPTTLAMLGLGLFGFAAARRRKQ